MKHPFLCLLNLMLAWNLSNADCNSEWPKCPQKGLNTVCVRGEDCSGVGNCEDLGKWADFRKWMTEIHNELRNNIALGNDTRGGNEAASNMNALSYDLDLEYVAQCHINRCDFNHDKCRLTKKFSSSVGQNLYAGTYKLDNEANIKHSVQAWYDEITDVTPDVVDGYHKTTPGTGHFTQIVWATTTHIGCGISKAQKRYFVACNYGPAGNFVGQKLYKKGPPCSSCDKGLSCNDKYKGLCGETIVASVGTVQRQFYWVILFVVLLAVVLA